MCKPLCGMSDSWKRFIGLFSHEKYSYPLALLKFGKLNHTNNSDTISILEKLQPSQHSVPEFDTIIFDGATVVQIASVSVFFRVPQKCLW